MNWADANVLPWLIPIPPLVAFALIILAAGRSRRLTHIIAIGAMTLSWLMSLALVFRAVQFPGLGTPETGVFGSSVAWLVNGLNGAGSGALNMGVMVDPLTTVMLFMVPLVCLMIFIYSLGYMFHDPKNPRFFAYLSLFAGAMLTLVVADNLLLLFVGWEVMGLCSYLLIGFWYERAPEEEIDGVAPYQAAQKAFMTTRVADVIMLLGIAYLWASTGTLNFREIFFNSEVLEGLAHTPALGGFLGLSAAGLIGICIVIGTIGKSAQFPLHVWLPDAMKGPTPVSAMIHAAAMVSAGVYLVIRMYPLLSAGSELEAGILAAPMTFMAVVGGFTALFAATIAVVQNDIKKVLAYSTISQLGFMVAALGVGGFAAAAFHLINHAFFKGLMFMASGSVIHAMEHGHHVAHGHGHGHDAHDDAAHAHAEHDAHGEHGAHGEHAAPVLRPPDFDPQDMRNMGGLYRRMPVTTITMVAGGLALMGFPLISAGFWSKDEIFLEAFVLPNPVGLFVLVFLALAAILTAFYTYRMLWMTFFGSPRTEAAVNASHYDPARGDGPAERYVSVTMTAPLIVLSVFAILAGFVGVHPDFPIVGPLLNALGIKKPFITFVNNTLPHHPHSPDFSIVPLLISLAVFTIGALVGYLLYTRRPVVAGQPDPVEGYVGRDVYRTLGAKYYLDEFYTRYLVRPFAWFADRVVNQIVDRGIIDGILHIVARAAERLGDVFKDFNRVVIDGVGDGIPEAIGDLARGIRPLQTGRIQQYLLYALIAALVVGINLAILSASPQPGVIAALGIVQGIIAVAVLFIFTPSGPPQPGKDGGVNVGEPAGSSDTSGD